MFDIGATELLVIAVVAILVIGPKDMPLALRTAGRWIGKIRRVSGHFRSGIDAMVREAELEEMEKEWREKNARIMAESPATAEAAGPEKPRGETASGEPDNLLPEPAPENAGETAAHQPAASQADGDAASAEGRAAEAPQPSLADRKS